MRKLKLVLVGLVVVFVLSDAPAFAQGMPSMGGGMNAPRRKLKKNNSPALSPALNMVPGVATSFEGQFLLRTIPQEKAINFASQTGRQIEGLQNQMAKTDAEIRTGMGKTGHSSSFMNYKGYYQMRSGGGRQR